MTPSVDMNGGVGKMPASVGDILNGTDRELAAKGEQLLQMMNSSSAGIAAGWQAIAQIHTADMAYQASASHNLMQMMASQSAQPMVIASDNTLGTVLTVAGAVCGAVAGWKSGAPKASTQMVGKLAPPPPEDTGENKEPPAEEAAPPPPETPETPKAPETPEPPVEGPPADPAQGQGEGGGSDGGSGGGGGGSDLIDEGVSFLKSHLPSWITPFV